MQRNPWSRQADICGALHVVARCGCSTHHKTLSWEGFSSAKAARDLLSSGFGEAFKEIKVKWGDWEAVSGVAKSSAFIRGPGDVRLHLLRFHFLKQIYKNLVISHIQNKLASRSSFQMQLPHPLASKFVSKHVRQRDILKSSLAENLMDWKIRVFQTEWAVCQTSQVAALFGELYKQISD